MTTDVITAARRLLPPGAIDLARHAAVPVAVDARFLNLLRVNFFLDSATPLPYETEAALLLSPLFREIGEGLYEIDPASRTALLAGLVTQFSRKRLERVAALLEQYTDHSAAWHTQPELENAQRLTALNVLDPARADAWLQREKAASTGGGSALHHSWFVAMEDRLKQQRVALEPAPAAISDVTVAIVTRSASEADALAGMLDDLERRPSGAGGSYRLGSVPSEGHPQGRHRVVVGHMGGAYSTGPATVDRIVRDFPQVRCLVVAGLLDVAARFSGREVIVSHGVTEPDDPESFLPGIDIGLLSNATNERLMSSAQAATITGRPQPTVRPAYFGGGGLSETPSNVVDVSSGFVVAAAVRHGLSWFVVKSVPFGPGAESWAAACTRSLLALTPDIGRALTSISSEPQAPWFSKDLLITVEEVGTTGGNVLLEFWHQSGPTFQPASAGSWRGSLDHIVGAIRGQLDILDRARNAEHQSAVEIFLPVALIDTPIASALAADRVVVVRSLERARAPEFHRLWRQNWRDLQNENGSIWHGNSLSPQILEAADLEQRSVIAAVLTGPPSTDSGAEELGKLLRAGAPAVLWDRRADSDAASRAALSNLVSEHLIDLPEQVRRLRHAAVMVADPNHPGQHIELLWDDPDRLLPGMIPAVIKSPPEDFAQPVRRLRSGGSGPSIAIITNLSIEAAAIRFVMDSAREFRQAEDPNSYYVGDLPSSDPGRAHQVVMPAPRSDGTREFTSQLTDALRTFPGIRTVIVCGIAGSRPEWGVQLGDVAVATGAIADSTASNRDLRWNSQPSAELLRADRELQLMEAGGDERWLNTFRSAEGLSAFARPPSRQNKPALHRGVIADAEILAGNLDNPSHDIRERRAIAIDFGSTALIRVAETLQTEWFLVRGIADFMDSLKGDAWHGYASFSAAAYVRALLAQCRPRV